MIYDYYFYGEDSFRFADQMFNSPPIDSNQEHHINKQQRKKANIFQLKTKCFHFPNYNNNKLPSRFIFNHSLMRISRL